MTTALMDTEAGLIELELFETDAPNTTANFVKLVKEGFYDGLAFHRVIPGFMAQGGCPNTRAGAKGMPGTGGPGYMIDCEINSQKHQAGTLAMAHAGKNTGGSQFYICFEPQPHLDGVHTVFGLAGSMDVVMKLKNGSKINKVTIQDS
ncbi:peptidylprolyl isomerase [Synechococcus sp. MIT S1220]|uniref:peptidylprolyl isomerase n=1 Tax=Synechococcus sp. MIT S1220 TaxID=3082549 RepID=UPI0039B010E1